MELRGGEDIVIPRGETVNDDLYAAANTITNRTRTRRANRHEIRRTGAGPSTTSSSAARSTVPTDMVLNRTLITARGEGAYVYGECGRSRSTRASTGAAVAPWTTIEIRMTRIATAQTSSAPGNTSSVTAWAR